MTSDELIVRFFGSRQSGWIDLEHQKRLADKLVMQYTDKQIETALELYKDKMYSLAFLSPKNMGKAIIQKQNNIHITYDTGGDISERNRQKLQRDTHFSRFGESDFSDLFEE